MWRWEFVIVIVSNILGCGKKDYLRVRIEAMRTETGGLRR